MKKEMTKKNREILESYKRSNFHSLSDVYSSCSHDKKIAYNHCVSEMNENNGFGGKIISRNSFMFTYGYMTIENNVKYLNVITKEKNYKFEIL